MRHNVEFSPLQIEITIKNAGEPTALHDLRAGVNKILRGQERMRLQLMTISDMAALVNANLDELDAEIQEEFAEFNDILANRALTAEEEAAFNGVLERIAASKRALDEHVPPTP
jgi:hypothetical protein